MQKFYLLSEFAEFADAIKYGSKISVNKQYLPYFV